jgi:hypothetical protein
MLALFIVVVLTEASLTDVTLFLLDKLSSNFTKSSLLLDLHFVIPSSSHFIRSSDLVNFEKSILLLYYKQS